MLPPTPQGKETDVQRMPRFGVALTGLVVLTALVVAGSAIGRSQAKPSNQQEPFISSKIAVVVGATLTGNQGTWNGTQPITLSNQWLRCNEGATDCNKIKNATGTSYTIVGGYAQTPVNNLDDQHRPIGEGYIVDYDSATGAFTNWKSYEHPKSPAGLEFVTHFEGISSVENGVYTLSAGSSLTGTSTFEVGSVATVRRNTDGSFGEAAWVDLSYPGVDASITSDSVVGNQVVGTNTEQKLAQLTYGLRGRIPDGMLVRVSSISPDNEKAYATQAEFLREIADSIAPQYQARVFGSAAL